MIKKYKPRLLTKESEGSSDEQDNSELTDNENTFKLSKEQSLP